jgi:hypothetical protein
MASSRPVRMPTRSASQPLASIPDPQIEVLFNLPSVRIVAFTTPSSIYRPGLSHGNLAVEEAPGTLPWVSRFERYAIFLRARPFEHLLKLTLTRL